MNMNKTVESLIGAANGMAMVVVWKLKLAFVSGGGAVRDMNMNKTVASLMAIGRVMQLVGTLAFVAGIVLSVKYWPATVVLVGGLTVMFVGKRLQRGAF